jgi:putative membrane protein
VVGKKITPLNLYNTLYFITGTVTAYGIVSLIPMTSPEELWFIFLSGAIAICAMILPGISGAFLLLIMGKYAFITGALKNPFADGHLLIIFIFCCGCLIGLLLFSRLLNFLLNSYQGQALAFLTGLMVGSMAKIWPYKEILETKIIRGKIHVLSNRNILPQECDLNLLFAVGLAVTGFIIVILLEKTSRK